MPRLNSGDVTESLRLLDGTRLDGSGRSGPGCTFRLTRITTTRLTRKPRCWPEQSEPRTSVTLRGEDLLLK